MVFSSPDFPPPRGIRPLADQSELLVRCVCQNAWGNSVERFWQKIVWVIIEAKTSAGAERSFPPSVEQCPIAQNIMKTRLIVCRVPTVNY